jgi:UDP-glucose 4-epimerase
MIKIEKNKLYLVTGGSGFLGVPLCERILARGGRVRTLARDEGKLIDLKQRFPDIEILTGDISDKFEVKQAMHGVHGVFHLAAFWKNHWSLNQNLYYQSVLTRLHKSQVYMELRNCSWSDCILSLNVSTLIQNTGLSDMAMYYIQLALFCVNGRNCYSLVKK